MTSRFKTAYQDLRHITAWTVLLTSRFLSSCNACTVVFRMVTVRNALWLFLKFSTSYSTEILRLWSYLKDFLKCPTCLKHLGLVQQFRQNQRRRSRKTAPCQHPSFRRKTKTTSNSTQNKPGIRSEEKTKLTSVQNCMCIVWGWLVFLIWFAFDLYRASKKVCRFASNGSIAEASARRSYCPATWQKPQQTLLACSVFNLECLLPCGET